MVLVITVLMLSIPDLKIYIESIFTCKSKPLKYIKLLGARQNGIYNRLCSHYVSHQNGTNETDNLFTIGGVPMSEVFNY